MFMSGIGCFRREGRFAMLRSERGGEIKMIDKIIYKEEETNNINLSPQYYPFGTCWASFFLGGFVK